MVIWLWSLLHVSTYSSVVLSSFISSPSALRGKDVCFATAIIQKSWWWMLPAWRSCTHWCPRSLLTGSAPWASSDLIELKVRGIERAPVCRCISQSYWSLQDLHILKFPSSCCICCTFSFWENKYCIPHTYIFKSVEQSTFSCFVIFALLRTEDAHCLLSLPNSLEIILEHSWLTDLSRNPE